MPPAGEPVPRLRLVPSVPSLESDHVCHPVMVPSPDPQFGACWLAGLQPAAGPGPGVRGPRHRSNVLGKRHVSPHFDQQQK